MFDSRTDLQMALRGEQAFPESGVQERHPRSVRLAEAFVWLPISNMRPPLSVRWLTTLAKELKAILVALKCH